MRELRLVITVLLVVGSLTPAMVNVHRVYAQPTLSPLPSTVKTCGVIDTPGTYRLDPTFHAVATDVSTISDHLDLSSTPGGPTTVCILIKESAGGSVLDMNGAVMSGLIPGQRAGIADVGIFNAGANVTITDLCASCPGSGLVTAWREGVALNESSTGSVIGVRAGLGGHGVNVSGNTIGVQIYGSLNAVSSDKITENTSLGGGFGVYILGASAHDNLVSNDNLTANGSSDVRISGSDRNRIVGNIIDTTLYAESGDQSNVLITQSSYNILRNNTIVNNQFFYGVSIIGGCCTMIGGLASGQGNSITHNAGGINVLNSPASRVENNLVRSNGFGLSINSNNGLIVLNDFSNNLDNGVLMSTGSANTLRGNTADNNGVDGYRIESRSLDIVTGNSANHNHHFGFNLTSISSSSLRANTADGNTYGDFYLTNVNSTSVRSNSATNTDTGLQLNTGFSNSLVANSMSGITGVGFYILGGSHNLFLGNKVASGGDGISLNGGSLNIIVGNNVSSNKFDGFDLDGNVNDFFVGNTASNDLRGFAIDPYTSGNTFFLNSADNNSQYGWDDSSAGSGTKGTANTYFFNECHGNTLGGSHPSGLCSPQP